MVKNKIHIKTCMVCKQSFTTNQPHKSTCNKNCRIEFKKIANKNWRINNPEKINNKYSSEYAKEYYLKYKDKITVRTQERRLKNPEHFRKISRKSYNKHKQSKFKRFYLRKQTDVNFNLMCLLRDRIIKAIKNEYKSGKSIDLLGCPIEKYKNFIENQFSEGMDWGNHGEWHIDHITPLNTFDLSKQDEQMKAFNYKNTRPLWASDNLRRPKDGSDLNEKKEKR